MQPETLNHGSIVEYVSVSPVGNLIASSGWDGLVKLWVVKTGEYRSPSQGMLSGLSSLNPRDRI